MSYSIVRRVVSGLGALAAVFALGALSTIPALAATPTAAADLKVIAAFDQPVYHPGDLIKVTLTITNAGTTTATGVHAMGADPHLPGGDTTVHVPSWGDLWYGMAPGIDITPGQTVTRTVSGHTLDPTQAVIGFAGVVGTDDFSGAPAESHFQITAKQIPSYGAYGGTITANGKGLAGVRIWLQADSGQPPYPIQTTDAQGHFLFSKIFTGTYYVDFHPPQGWVVQTEHHNQQVVVRIEDATSHLDDHYVAMPPLSDSLDASITFDQPSYHTGENAHLTVVLTNRGTTTLSHVTSACNGDGNPNIVSGNTPGWGALAFNAAGVTLVPGETATYHVWEPVPAGALPYGQVYAGCEFGPNVGGPAVGYPMARASARVVAGPGGTSTPSPTSTVPSSTSSTPTPSTPTSSGAGPGSSTAAVPTSATTPSAPGSTKLPYTGVSALWPAIGGLVLLAAGSAAILFARRRKTTG